MRNSLCKNCKNKWELTEKELDARYEKWVVHLVDAVKRHDRELILNKIYSSLTDGNEEGNL